MSQPPNQRPLEAGITTDLRAVLRSVLHDHLRVARQALDTTVLPGTSALKPIDLLKT